MSATTGWWSVCFVRLPARFLDSAVRCSNVTGARGALTRVTVPVA